VERFSAASLRPVVWSAMLASQVFAYDLARAVVAARCDPVFDEAVEVVRQIDVAGSAGVSPAVAGAFPRAPRKLQALGSVCKCKLKTTGGLRGQDASATSNAVPSPPSFFS